MCVCIPTGVLIIQMGIGLKVTQNIIWGVGKEGGDLVNKHFP